MSINLSFNRNSILFYLLFWIQPFWALLIILTRFAKQIPNKADIFLITFILSLIGIYWYPFGDSQTHFGIYYADVVERFYKFSLFNSNYVYDYILTWISKVLGNYVWGYFVWIFVPLLMYNMSIWTYAKKYKDYYLLFICMFIFIGCRETLDLNRNTAAALIMVTGLLRPKRIFSFILISFSCLIHSSLLVITILGMLIYQFCTCLTIKKICWIYFVSFTISLVSPAVISLFASEKLIEMYVTGSAGAGVTVPSGFFYIMNVLNIIIFIIIGIYTTISYPKLKSSKLFPFYLISSILTLCTWFLWTMRERFLLINLIIGFAIIIVNWNQIKSVMGHSKIFLIKSIITLSVFRFIIVMCVEYSSEIIHHTGSRVPMKTLSIVVSPFYLPTPCILNIDEFGFSDERYLHMLNKSNEVVYNHRYR